MNISQKLNETMKTRTATSTEEYEIKSHTNSIPSFFSGTKSMSKNEQVTGLPPLPVKKDALKIIDQSLFENMQIDFNVCDDTPLFKDLDTFIASAPKTHPYRIKVTKKDKEGKATRAYIIYEKESDDPEKEPKSIIISKVPYYHSVKTHNIDDDREGCILSAYRDAKLIQLPLVMADVAEPQKLIKIMANSGVLAPKGADNRDYIYEQNLECQDTRLFVNTLGFRIINKKLCYVYPQGEGLNASVYYSQQELALRHALAVNGDSMIWFERVVKPLNLNNSAPTVPFLLFSALMPLFSTLVPEFQGILINIIPDDTEESTSSTGKTTLQRAMLSMQGEQEWMISWNTTANAVEARLHDGIGAYFDDLSTGNIKNMEKVVYDNANGSQRARLNQDGTAKNVKHRNSVIFSSGEERTLHASEVKDGALVRAIDVELKASDFGSDDSNHTKKVVDTIKTTVHHHYGFVYRAVIPMIIEEKDLMIEQVGHYKAHFSGLADDPLSKRLSLHYAIIALCGDLMIIALQKIAGDASLLSDLDPLHITASMFRKQMKILRLRDNKHLMTLDVIQQSIIIEDNEIFNQYKTPIGVVDNEIRYIKSTEVSTILKELNNVVPSRFFKWLDEKGYLYEKDKEGGRFTKTKRINGSSVKTYAFNFNVKNSGNTGIGGNLFNTIKGDTDADN